MHLDTNEKEIKGIIFDFDGTLYEGDVWEKWTSYVRGLFAKTFKDPDQIYTKYDGVEDANSNRLAEILIAETGSAKALYEYQWNNMFQLDLDKLVAIDNERLARLKEKYPLFIVTNSAGNYLRHYLKTFGLDEKNFKELLDNKYESDDPTKKKRYLEILNKYNLSPENVIVIGDNYVTDIIPAIELNMQYCYTQTLDEVKQIIDNLL